MKEEVKGPLKKTKKNEGIKKSWEHVEFLDPGKNRVLRRQGMVNHVKTWREVL